MRRLSSRSVATASDGFGVTSSPLRGRRPPLETNVARTVSNALQRSIPPCARSTKSKRSVMGWFSPDLGQVQRPRSCASVSKDDYDDKVAANAGADHQQFEGTPCAASERRVPARVAAHQPA